MRVKDSNRNSIDFHSFNKSLQEGMASAVP